MIPHSSLGNSSLDNSYGDQGLSPERSFGLSNNNGGVTLEEWKQRFMGIIHKAEVDLLYACMGNHDQIHTIKESMQGLKTGVTDLLEMLTSLVEKLIRRYKKSATKTNKYWEAAMDDMKDRLANEKRSAILEADRRRRLQAEVKKLRNQLSHQRRTMLRSMNGGHGVRRSTKASSDNVDAVNTREFEEEKESTMSTEPERLHISQRNNAAETDNTPSNPIREKNKTRSLSSPSPSPASPSSTSPSLSPRSAHNKIDGKVTSSTSNEYNNVSPNASDVDGDNEGSENSPSSLLQQKVRARIKQRTSGSNNNNTATKQRSESLTEYKPSTNSENSNSQSPRERLQERIRSRLGQRAATVGSPGSTSDGSNNTSGISNQSGEQDQTTSPQETKQSRSESLRANLRARLEKRKNSSKQS